LYFAYVLVLFGLLLTMIRLGDEVGMFANGWFRLRFHLAMILISVVEAWLGI